MAHINLLPWREELRKQKQQQFAVVAAGTAILGGLLVLLVGVVSITRGNSRITLLRRTVPQAILLRSAAIAFRPAPDTSATSTQTAPAPSRWTP